MSTSESVVAPETLRRTALYGAHFEAEAKLVPFAGWEMPVQYRGIREEVKAVREGCGVFDVSHMGQLLVSGPHATQQLNRALSNDWSTLPIGRVAYALLLDESGGVLDDLMGYRFGENDWMIVVNASRAQNDEAVLRARLSGLDVEDLYDAQAMLAIQGPLAEQTLQPFTEYDLSTLRWRDCVLTEVGGGSGLLARGGYTGADGFEFMCDGETGTELWDELLKSGATPCGLGARDVLRLEAGLPLYGHELREEWTPFESGCGFAVKMEKEFFVGQDALREKENANDHCARTIKALRMDGKAIPREDYQVLQNKAEIGAVTSGTWSPTLDAGIALASLPRELQAGDDVEVLIRDKPHPAKIVPKPFVAFGKK